MSAKTYRIKEGAPQHYIGGRFYAAGATGVTLPEGVNPGQWLAAEGEPEADDPKPAKADKADKAK